MNFEQNPDGRQERTRTDHEQGRGEEGADRTSSSPSAVRKVLDRVRGENSPSAWQSGPSFSGGFPEASSGRPDDEKGTTIPLKRLPPDPLARRWDAEGNEHHVWFDVSIQRVWKLAKHSRSFGVSDSLYEYVQRWEAQNFFWNDDVRIEGFLPDGRVLISQPFVKGKHVCRAQLHRRLEDLGWKMYRGAGNVWVSSDDRVVMKDAHEGNFVLDEEGFLRAIDVNLISMAEFLQYEDDEWLEPTHLSELIDSLDSSERRCD
jgi:hypothetical protein